MWTGVLKQCFVLFGVGFVIIAMTVGCATTQSERHREMSKEDIYFDTGVAAADSVYKSALPIFAGYVTGMVAPVPFAFVPPVIFGAGILGALAALVGGNKVIESNTITTPAELTDGFSELHRESFERGYSERVKELRKGRYGLGVVAGVVTDMILIVRALSGYGGFNSDT